MRGEESALDYSHQIVGFDVGADRAGVLGAGQQRADCRTQFVNRPRVFGGVGAAHGVGEVAFDAALLDQAREEIEESAGGVG